MPTAPNLTLRVDGVEYPRVTLRFKMEDGYPGGPRELVIQDEILGPFLLTNDCTLELKEGGGAWKAVSLPFLITMLEVHRTA